MPGSGINPENVNHFKVNNFKNIHFSAADLILKSTNRKELSFIHKPFLEEDKVVISSFNTIQEIVKMVK